MSDKSLEAVEVTSNPVEDVKEAVQEVETSEAEAEDVKPEAEKEVKEPTKLELAQQETERVKAKMQERINRITAARKQEQDRLHKLEQEFAQSKPAIVDDTPKEDNFDSWEDYNQAIIEYKAEKLVQDRLRASKEAELQQAQRVEYEKRKAEFDAKEHEFRSKNADYDEKATSFKEQADLLLGQYGSNSPTLNAMNEVVFSSEMSPSLINELGSKPEILEELATMQPVQAARELFKLEMALSKTSETKIEQPLPKPIKSLKGTGKPNKSLDSMTAKELLDWVKNK